MNPNYRIELADNMKGSEKMAFNNDSSSLDTVIKVIGIGNGGCNAVNRMIEEGLKDVEFIAMNTDAQALSRSNAPTRIVLGDRVTQGLGAGTDPEKGAEAAREDIANIEEVVNGANLVFIASSFGGGTGTGASPVVAEAAKKAGALTIGVVTKPFEYEGKLKMSRAESGIDKMLTVVDSLIIIPNENLYDMVDMDNYSYEEALSVVDDVLRQGVQGISDIITQTGFINVDFADVKTMISLSNGRAHLGIGVGKGDERLQKAITNAFENPLLDVSSIKNARGILANIVCPKDFAMKEYREASKIINNYANDNANIKIGVCPKEELKDEIIVTIVATGFDANSKNNSENKDIDSNANDIINKSASSNKSEIINNNNNSNSSNDVSANNSYSPAVDTNNKKEEDISSSKNEINKAEVSEKIISESKISSKNIAENIVDIDNINTIVKEPQEGHEVELETLNINSEINIEKDESVEAVIEKNEAVIEEEKEEIKENVLISNNNDKVQETKEYKFENYIRNLKKPLITKANRFNNLNDSITVNNNEEENDNKKDIKETFNRTIVNNNSEYAHRYETKERISEEMRFEEEEKHNNPHSDYHKNPFDIVSDDYMDKHNKMGSKMSIFGETSTIDNDLEKPAFLRRQIQARNTMR
ncbi:cell division protein FtsZ [Brachyspira hampsonii]|uniref:Cell division protein FtsZ n=2 Tax=Brachyspira hampsonii TaxID=1287055 RepID=A0AAC9TTT5_9SPIR|nr:cell division protein FtsZ [Brachyspira hampsonii]ASJ20634.1 cell division protein FtsZ [Brachyspira hampsonii]MBW5380424.1 cell division protein FtsZ [Brachyspira hampsonii]MBW5408992.1 cell division protein FtsZ [Brachyspira hampsonii]OEJ18414.1 cell division protein FtsZ [Brachyspira hampsonii]